MAKIHIGTSGWHYAHWVGPVYPKGLNQKNFLAHYAQSLASVEINATFYKLPEVTTLVKWREGTPKDFLFACKASRYLTHRKRLKDPQKSSALFFDAVAHLEEKLGPVLVQLPPKWRVNPDRLEHFLATVAKRYRLAFEFRDESWFDPTVYRLLQRHGAAFCVYELSGRQSPVEVTASFVYVRLHGPEGAYRGRYGEKGLKPWAKRLRAWRKQGLDVYCYFDNDQAGYAFADALQLASLVT